MQVRYKNSCWLLLALAVVSSAHGDGKHSIVKDFIIKSESPTSYEVPLPTTTQDAVDSPVKELPLRPVSRTSSSGSVEDSSNPTSHSLPMPRTTEGAEYSSRKEPPVRSVSPTTATKKAVDSQTNQFLSITASPTAAKENVEYASKQELLTRTISHSQDVQNKRTMKDTKEISLKETQPVTLSPSSEEVPKSPTSTTMATNDPFDKIVPLDGEDLVEATDFLIANLSEYRESDYQYMAPYLLEAHNQTDNISGSTYDFLEQHRYNEFQTSMICIDEVTAAAYRAMDDFSNITNKVYSGANEELGERISKFEQKQNERYAKAQAMSRTALDRTEEYNEDVRRQFTDYQNTFNTRMKTSTDQLQSQTVIPNAKMALTEAGMLNPEAVALQGGRVRRADSEGNFNHMSAELLDENRDLTRKVTWGLRPLTDSVDPLKTYLRRTQKNLDVELEVLEASLQKILQKHRNQVQADMWRSTVSIIRQLDTGMQDCLAMSDASLRETVRHLNSTSQQRPQQVAHQVYSNVSRGMEASSLQMEELAAGLRMVTVTDVTLALFVISLLLLASVLTFAFWPRVQTEACQL